MDELMPFLVSVALLVVIGLGCLMAKRDMVRLLIGVEILFNAANLSFVAFSLQAPIMSDGVASAAIDPFAQSLVMMSIVLDGTVIAVGLAMALNVYKHYKTLDIRKLRRLRW